MSFNSVYKREEFSKSNLTNNDEGTPQSSNNDYLMF